MVRKVKGLEASVLGTLYSFPFQADAIRAVVRQLKDTTNTPIPTLTNLDTVTQAQAVMRCDLFSIRRDIPVRKVESLRPFSVALAGIVLTGI